MGLEEYEIKVVWKDRKRYLGMPISFTKYSISDDRLFLDRGLLNTKSDEILLYRVRDIGLEISLFQRIFGVGTITVKSSDKTLPILEIKNIKKPKAVKELIHQKVEQMKISRRMHVGEIIDDDTCMHTAEADEMLSDETEEY